MLDIVESKLSHLKYTPNNNIVCTQMLDNSSSHTVKHYPAMLDNASPPPPLLDNPFSYHVRLDNPSARPEVRGTADSASDTTKIELVNKMNQ